MVASTANRLGIKRLDHVGVQVRDVERAERFYTEVLGAKVLFRMGAEPNDPYGFRHTFLLLGDQRYELVENPGYRAYATPADMALYPHYAFGVDAENLEACVAWLDEVGLPHDGPVMHPPSTAASVYFTDQDGNHMEFVAVTGYPREKCELSRGTHWDKLLHTWG
jgi:lactoylglutathione lyase